MRARDDAGACRRHGGGFFPPAAAIAALAALVAFGDADVARAHARLLRTTPGAAERLAAPPSTLDLWFNEILDETFNAVELFTAAPGGHPGTRIEIGPPAVDPADRTHLSARVPPLSPGRYVVHWRVLSRDGHPVRGRLEFAVASGASSGR